MIRGVLLLSVMGVSLLDGCDSKAKTTETGSLTEDTAADSGASDADDDDTSVTDSECSGEATEGDADGDGIPDAVEDTLDDLDSDSADTDGDGICDGDEDSDGDNLTNEEELDVGTDLGSADTDGDGITDDVEVNYTSENGRSFDPLDASDGGADWDGDGLSNAQEIGSEGSGTDPEKVDTDGDGFPDGYEVKKESDPTDRDSEPEFNEILTCSADNISSSKGRHFAVDEDGNDRDDVVVEDYYGRDYESGKASFECSCTMTLDEGYARVADLVVYTPTAVHLNSPWEDSGSQEPIIGAVRVPFTASSREGGEFLLDDISQSKMLDLNKDKVLHWLAEPTDSLASSGVVSVAGDYTVWISVKNPIGDVIEADDITFSEGCARLAGNDSDSGYAGYLRLSLIPASYLTDDNSASSSSGCTSGQESDFMLVAGLGGRLRMLAVSGSDGFSQMPLSEISIASWNDARKVQLRQQGELVATLTAEKPEAVLPRSMWLHQLDVVVEGPQGATLPTLTALHTCSDQQPPVPPGKQFPLSLLELDTFLASANSLLSASGSVPEDTQLTLPALSARIEEPPEGKTGPSWLRIDARGSGPLATIPLAPEGDGEWSFEHTDEGFSVKGVLSVNSSGELSVSLESGNVGALQLDEATLVLEN